MHTDLTAYTFAQLIDKEPAYGAVLDAFGLDFISEPERILSCACLEKGLDLRQVCQKLNEPKSKFLSARLALSYGSCSEIIAYLKEAHRYFMRFRLPYMLRVISRVKDSLFDDKEMAHDLKLVFPEFALDFSAHILEEEQSSFELVLKLEAAQWQGLNGWPLYNLLEMANMASIISNHSEEDDEMHGIRMLTHDYRVYPHTSPYQKLIFIELQNFENELAYHARIENELLFPKALEIENQLRQRLSLTASRN